ncbi:hypothetical protein, partial [Acidithiobacillus caldus]|uniref:hypothetical protein n=1 Tax=Acidithiobacillus caldus TaxID=33059 RepID=UPI0030B84C2F
MLGTGVLQVVQVPAIVLEATDIADAARGFGFFEKAFARQETCVSGIFFFRPMRRTVQIRLEHRFLQAPAPDELPGSHSDGRYGGGPAHKIKGVLDHRVGIERRIGLI